MTAESPVPGVVAWCDITVPDAVALRDFYADVTGWRPQPLAMEGYDDFNMMLPGSDEPAAGICHARGQNADLPPQWLIYIAVPDLGASAQKALDRGAVHLSGALEAGDDGGYAVFRDPAGAAFALYQAGAAI